MPVFVNQTAFRQPECQMFQVGWWVVWGFWGLDDCLGGWVLFPVWDKGERKEKANKKKQVLLPAFLVLKQQDLLSLSYLGQQQFSFQCPSTSVLVKAHYSHLCGFFFLHSGRFLPFFPIACLVNRWTSWKWKGWSGKSNKNQSASLCKPAMEKNHVTVYYSVDNG